MHIDKYLVSVAEAKSMIAACSTRLEVEYKSLSEASGHVTAEDIIAPYSIPAFPQSSMDGYTLAFAALAAGAALNITGEMAAGPNEQWVLPAGNAARIFTGAPVPDGADTVVMQEKVKAADGRLTILDDNLVPGANVRPVGSEIEQGNLALPAGSKLTPAAMGFLAGIGIEKVSVYPLPAVTIIVTGNELTPPGNPLNYGEVYEANSFTLRSALQQFHMQPVTVYRSPDDIDELSNCLRNALAESDVVLMTGGVSVGEYDFTLKAAELNDIRPQFHKIRQKPGKPIFFGTQGAKLVFGLPGNPASVLTCFYEYVLPAISHMSGQHFQLREVEAILKRTYKKPAGITHFLKGNFDGTMAEAMYGQESYRLSSFARSNCLIVLGEDITTVEAGDTVTVHLLPNT